MADRTRPVIGITMDIQEGRLTLKTDYAEAVRQAGGLPLLIPLEGGEQAYAERMDGLLIPGGGDLEPSYYGEAPGEGLRLVPRLRSDFEIALIHEIIGLRKPVLGICYGMQLLNVALGGSLYQDIARQVPQALNHLEDHEIEITRGGRLRAGTFPVNSSHHQAIKIPGRALEVLAVSPDGLAEAIHMRDHPFLLGVQWHPERPGGQADMVFAPFVEAARGG